MAPTSGEGSPSLSLGPPRLLQADAVSPAGPVPIRRELGVRVRVLRRSVDTLEVDKRPRAFAARDEVDRHLIERAPQRIVHRRHGDAELLRSRDLVVHREQQGVAVAVEQIARHRFRTQFVTGLYRTHSAIPGRMTRRDRRHRDSRWTFGDHATATGSYESSRPGTDATGPRKFSGTALCRGVHSCRVPTPERRSGPVLKRRSAEHRREHLPPRLRAPVAPLRSHPQDRPALLGAFIAHRRAMTATADLRGAGWSGGNPRDYDREFYVSLQVSPQLHARVPFAYRDGAQRARPAIVDPAQGPAAHGRLERPVRLGVRGADPFHARRGAAAAPRKPMPGACDHLTPEMAATSAIRSKAVPVPEIVPARSLRRRWAPLIPRPIGGMVGRDLQ